MKTFFTFLIFLIGLASFAQSEEVIGDYLLSLKTEDGSLFEWKLTLSQDGTFFFHYYKNIKTGIPPEGNTYGKGKWTVKDKVVSFDTDRKDLDEKHTLDFTNSKARFIIKSPKDKSDRIIKTKLQFLESGISWMQRTGLFKI